MALYCMLYTVGVYAQSGSLTGIVTDASTNESMPAVNVVITELTRGTATDVDGKYSITNIPAGTYTVRVTSVGYKIFEEKINISSGETVLNIALEVDIFGLDEMVVTALGIEKEQRAVTFATQQVSAEMLNITQDANIKSSLAGKVAGVQIVGQAGSKLGEFGKIRIRGNISLTSDLEPLYVVDGIPTDDPNAIDMNNVAEVNVLKGPNATTLYGQRGEAGVIIITTKGASGLSTRDGKMGVSVEVTSALTFDKVAYLPDYQNDYGQGYSGEGSWSILNYAEGANGGSWGPYPEGWEALDGQRYINESYADESWGPKFDGGEYIPWYAWYPDSPYYGQTATWEAQKDNIKDFYDTGVTAKTGFAVNLFNDTFSGRVSYSNLNQNGIIPESSLKKDFLAGKFDYDVNDKIKVGVDVNYTLSNIEGDFDDGYGNQVSGSFNSWFARDLDTEILKDLKDLKTHNGYSASWNWWGPDYYALDYNYGVQDGDFEKPTFWFNPYKWLDAYKVARKTEDLLVGLNGSYNFDDNWSVSASANRRKRDYRREFYLPYEMEYSSAHSLYIDYVNSYGFYNTLSTENNFEGLIKYANNFGEWGLDAFVGGNIRVQKYNRYSADMNIGNEYGGLIIPDVYTFSNSAERINPVTTEWKKKVYSVYGKLTLDYKKMLYVDASLREDWSSALPSNNNGYAYPGISASFVFSELIDSDILSFGKLRAGWAQVGNDVSAESINPQYILSANAYTHPVSGEPLSLLYTDNTIIDPNIKPAINSSFEVGVDLKFFENRIGLSTTYFNDKREDEIVSVSVSNGTGSSYFLTNAGVSERSGIELVLEGTPVITKDFRWDVTMNYANSTTTVTELPAGLESYQMGGYNDGFSDAYNFVYVTHKLDEDWGQLRGGGYKRGDDGKPLVTQQGMYVVEQDQYFGSVLPDFTGGFLNTFSYKNLTMTASIDFQKGGKFFSLTEMWGAYSGLTKETVATNDNGMSTRDPVADGGGVHVVGKTVDGADVDTYVEAQDYWGQWYSNRLAEPFIHDADYIKLREISLSYTLPKKITGKALNSATFGFIARNLWLIAVADDNKHGWDPSELSQVYGENGQLPGTRSYGFNIKLTF